MRLHDGTHPKDERELLSLFLSATPDERRFLFAPTAKAASDFRLSQRTLQLWIEQGCVLAIRNGRNYQVYLPDVERYIVNCNNETVPQQGPRNMRILRK
jgi:hypothetical protein